MGSGYSVITPGVYFHCPQCGGKWAAGPGWGMASPVMVQAGDSIRCTCGFLALTLEPGRRFAAHMTWRTWRKVS